MSLMVPPHVLEMAERDEEMSPAVFWCVVQESLPYFVKRVKELVANLKAGETIARTNHAPANTEEFGQLLRGFASTPIKRAAERQFGIDLEFVNCHMTLAKWTNDQSAETISRMDALTSTRSQLLNQSPELVNC